MTWRRSIRAFALGFCACLPGISSAAVAQSCPPGESEFLNEIKERMGKIDSLLVKLHNVHIMNDSVLMNSGVATSSTCKFGLIILKRGEITFGFGQFSLSDTDDRDLLLDLLDQAVEHNPVNLPVALRELLKGNLARPTTSDRDLLLSFRASWPAH